MKNYQAFFLRIAFSCFFITILCNSVSYGQVVDIIANPSSTGNGAFGASTLYAANESIYTEAEIGAGNFITPATSIDQVAFNIITVGANTSFTNITIWMKEVPLATTAFSTGTYDTAGYTKVFNGAVILAGIGWAQIPLTTPFKRTSGNNLQVLIERKDGVGHAGYVYRTSNGNSADKLALSCRRYNSSAVPVSNITSLAASAISRVQIRLFHVHPNDALVQEIYSLGKLPIPFGAPHTIKANITNVGSNALTNLPVTLNITGANTFTNVQTIPSLASGASADVSFSAFTPTVQGSDNISVSIPNDDFSANNLKSVIQSINNNTFSYSYGPVPFNAVGFNGTTGDFVARFNTSVATAISQVAVNFITGGQPFQVGIWDATGAGGKPGNLLFSSAIQTSTAGVYILPILPAVPIGTGDFFVGVQQTGTVNVSFAYQNEDPIRLNTFYWEQLPTFPWTDFAPASRFRFMIEPKLQLPIDANVTSIITPAANCSAGPVNYGAVLSNVGLNTINAGTANITLKIGGANTYSASITNTTNIVSGSSETITFSGVNIINPGTNLDTVFVSLTGDTEQANDTLRTTDISAAPVSITSFPAIENAEASPPTLLSNFKIVAGSTQLWRVQTGNYTNVDQPTPLAPHLGTKFYLFDSYGGPSSDGFVSRLSSKCITLPVNTGNNCYKLQFYMSHDNTSSRLLDSLYVTVSANNGASWTRLLPGYRRFNAANSTPAWQKLEKDLSAYASQTIQIGFEGVSNYGNAFGLDDITVIPAQPAILSASTNNAIALSKACDDQGWTYYSNPANPDSVLFSINWDPSASGANVAAKAATKLTIQVDPALFAAEDIPGKKATYTMKRYWNLDPGASTLTGPVNIRFFYDATEKTAVDNAASTFATANTGTLETPTWFKTNGTDFIGDATHVNPDGVLNAIPLTNVNELSNNTINGILYAEFDGISSFSGGTYASGVGLNTPLPVTLLSFDAKRSGKINQLDWSTSQEINTNRFVIERSADGRNFSSIGEIAASGNSNSILKYSFSDNTPVRGINYYRLLIVDTDNSSRYSAIRSVRNEGSADIAIYPNPAKASLNVKITADKADKAEMAITDNSGKIVITKTLAITQGINLVPVNINKLSAGSYVMKITLSDDVVIRKFNKQ